MLVKHPIWVISDDIYNRMIFDGLPYAHLVQARPELRDRVIIVDSISKTYGMPGWRVGFVAASESVAQSQVTLNSNHITSLPEVVTAAATAAFDGPQDIPREKCADFAKRRDEVMAALKKIPGLNCPTPQGAFYAFPDISVAFGKKHGDQADQQRCRFLQRAARRERRSLRAGLGIRRAKRDANFLHMSDNQLRNFTDSRVETAAGFFCVN